MSATSNTRRLVSRMALASWASAALLGMSPAQASDFRYWFLDDNGWMQPGDLSLGNAKLVMPNWACARRFYGGATLNYIGEYGNSVNSEDVGVTIDVQTRGAVNGCQPKPRLDKRYGPNDIVSITEPANTHYIEFDSYDGGGSYWIDKNGARPFCNCTLSNTFTTLIGDKHWAMLDATFKAQLERVEGQNGGWILIENISAPMFSLQRSLATEVARRRQTPFGELETPVRQLEDLATAALDKAVGQVEDCRRTQAAGARDPAWKACSLARQSLALSRSALRTLQGELRR